MSFFLSSFRRHGEKKARDDDDDDDDGSDAHNTTRVITNGLSRASRRSRPPMV